MTGKIKGEDLKKQVKNADDQSYSKKTEIDSSHFASNLSEKDETFDSE